jgi:hypothetical protein
MRVLSFQKHFLRGSVREYLSFGFRPKYQSGGYNKSRPFERAAWLFGWLIPKRLATGEIRFPGQAGQHSAQRGAFRHAGEIVRLHPRSYSPFGMRLALYLVRSWCNTSKHQFIFALY